MDVIKHMRKQWIQGIFSSSPPPERNKSCYNGTISLALKVKEEVKNSEAKGKLSLEELGLW